MANCNNTPNNCLPIIKCQADPITTNDIKYVGEDDICLGILAPITLTDVLRKIITFEKNRLFSIISNSTVVTTIPSTCNKTQRIEIVPSADSGNSFILGTDGYPFVPAFTAGIINLNILDTNTVHLSGNGNTIPLTADVKLNPALNNLTEATPTGLLTQEVKVNDIQRNLIQHIIFERPPIKQLSYSGLEPDGVTPFTINLTKIFICQGGSYSNNFTLNNPDVDLFWGDTVNYEHSLDNEIGAGISLSHDYLTLQPSSGEIELKTYNNSSISQIATNTRNSVITGFKFIKGGDLINTISIIGSYLSTSAVMDFKDMINVTYLNLIPTHYGPNSSITLKNTQDLESLLTANLSGIFEGDNNLTFINSNFSQLQLLGGFIGIKTIVLTNKPNLSIFADTASLDTFDFTGSNLSQLNLNQCGAGFNAFINKVILKLNPFTPTGPMFNFSILKVFNFSYTNGIKPDGTIRQGGYNVPVPTKFLMYDKINANKLDFVEVNQDWIKNELFISLDANTLIKGISTCHPPFSIGLNFNQLYYNPTWAPLNGKVAFIYVTQTAGVVTSITNGGNTLEYSGGFNYNIIPSIITSGPGTGLITQEVMSLLANPQNITNGGTGYVVNTNYTLTGTGSIISPIIKVISVTAGSITEYNFVNEGEFTTLPSTLTHAGGLVISTTNKWAYKRSIVLNGGIGYTAASIYKLEATTINGTGTGTASAQAKTAIDSLHQKGWNLAW